MLGASRLRCAVATGASSAFVWDLGKPTGVAIHPDGPGPVNSVLLTADGTELLIGLGMYPLGDQDTEAAIELWTLEPEPWFACRRRLTGVCVDGLEVNRYDGSVAAIVGARSQDRGYVFLLNEGDLRVREVLEVDWAITSQLRWSSQEDWIVAAYNEEVWVWEAEAHVGGGWRLDLPKVGPGGMISADGRQVISSDGRMIQSGPHAEVELPRLPDTVATCFGPDNVVFGLSRNGTLRTWWLE